MKAQNDQSNEIEFTDSDLSLYPSSSEGSCLWKIEGGEPEPEPEPEPDPEPEPEPEPSEGGGASAKLKAFFKEALKQLAIAGLFNAVAIGVKAILNATAADKKKHPDQPIDWWKNVVKQMQDFDYKGADANGVGVIQTNLVIELQTWLQKNKPKAVSGSEAFLKQWSQESQRDLKHKLIGMDTVEEMAQYMQTYTVSGVKLNGGKPPFICGSTPVIEAAQINFG